MRLEAALEMSAVDQYVVVDEGQAFLVSDRQKASKRRETYWKHVAASIAAYPLRLAPFHQSSEGSLTADADGDQTNTSAGSEESCEGPKSRNNSGTGLKKAYEVPRGSDGKPLMPLVLFKGLTILSLGTIKIQPGWHSKRYIWPVGFKSLRQYASMHDPDTKVDYINEIVESSSGGSPLFRVSCTENGSLFPSVIIVHAQCLHVISLLLNAMNRN